MKTVKHYRGVSLILSSVKGRVRTLGRERRRIPVGHGLQVDVNGMVFKSMYAAKQYINRGV